MNDERGGFNGQVSTRVAVLFAIFMAIMTFGITRFGGGVADTVRASVVQQQVLSQVMVDLERVREIVQRRGDVLQELATEQALIAERYQHIQNSLSRIERRLTELENTLKTARSGG